MARSHAKIKTDLWSNADFLALSCGAQWLFHVLLEQPTLSLCGVVPLTVSRWASFAKDATQRQVRTWLEDLRTRRFVVVSEATEEVWVRSFTKHDGVLVQPNVVVAMAKDFEAIHSADIRRRFIEGLPEPFPEGLPEPFPEGYRRRFPEGFTEGLPEAFREALLARGRLRTDSDSTTDSAVLTSGTTTSDLHAAGNGGCPQLDTQAVDNAIGALDAHFAVPS